MQKIKNKLKKITFLRWIKKQYDFVKSFFRYIIGKINLKFNKIDVNIMSLDESLDYIKKNNCSVIRYGDGEFMYMNNVHPIIYQKQDKKLVKRLEACLDYNNDKILICIPEPIASTDNLVTKSKWHWTHRISKDINIYSRLNNKYNYGNAFISRPYIVYKNKNEKAGIFKKIRNIWDEKKILLIEGEYSRSGVGNDLFKNVKSLHRIICPSKDAFDYYEIILKKTLDYLKQNEVDLVLIAIGPTSKPLVVDLTKKNHRAIDIGHIDSEYEWFKIKALKRVSIKNKHTAESSDDTLLTECFDINYQKSIVIKIGAEDEK